MCLFILSIIFHSFPKDEELRKKWLHNLRRKNFTPTKYSRLCSKHFNEEDIDRTSLARVRLRRGAVPCIFEAFPKHLRLKSEHKRKSPTKRVVTAKSNQSESEYVVANSNHCSETESMAKENETLKRNLDNVASQIAVARKKIKVLQQSKRRLMKRNSDLKSVVNELQRKRYISEDSLGVLEKYAGGVTDLLKRQVAKHTNNQSVSLPYSPELRRFALTLHFYSPQAYRYVRKMFDTCLPHPRTIQRWYECVDGKPGFTEAAFSAIKLRADMAAKTGKPLLCSLVMDEMVLRQQVEWDGMMYHGYIDMGTEMDDDSLPIAKEALVLMVVSINDGWKLPVGYFLIAGLGASERGNVVHQCLEKLHLVGATVSSITCDGASANVSTIKHLGCNFEYETVESSFPHPVTKDPVCVMLDPCHMLKLVRNCLGDKKCMLDQNGNYIKWEYIEQLHKLQDREELNLGNKLRFAHIAWQRKKMNVKLAAQLLSESVAKSLRFCLDEEIAEFKGCAATIEFIMIFNTLFDIMNTRHLNAGSYKCPMQHKNAKDIKDFLVSAESYIRSLVFPDGQLVIRSNRKTGFLGFLFCIRSLQYLYDTLIASPKPSLRFLMTYKLSQDHIELLFGLIRGKGGWNNNPTVRQFSSAYKKLFVHNDLKDTTQGNCLPLESVPILTVSGKGNATMINDSVTKKNVLENMGNEEIEDYVYIPSHTHISKCVDKIVVYIAGFVAHKLMKSIHCEPCIDALSSDQVDSKHIHSLIKLKDRGKLVYPSDDVIDICITAEKLFRQRGSCTDFKRVGFCQLITSVLEQYTHKNIFLTLARHMYDTEPMENHLHLLTKAVAESYLQVRYKYDAKQLTQKLGANCKVKSRQVYTI